MGIAETGPYGKQWNDSSRRLLYDRTRDDASSRRCGCLSVLRIANGGAGEGRHLQCGLRIPPRGFHCAVSRFDWDIASHLLRTESSIAAALVGGAKGISSTNGTVMRDETTRRPLITAGTALGIGMGGFVDGIVLHQLLQVHNMLSSRCPTKGVDVGTLVVNLQINMFWDGLFHVLTWTMTAAGLALLWNAVRSLKVPLSGKTLIGSMTLGWGLFNLVEGVIDHHLLHIHHVTETVDHFFWDIAFLGSGVLMIVVGWLLIGRSGYAAVRSPITQ
jgi:uncharacterized membrane protein